MPETFREVYEQAAKPTELDKLVNRSDGRSTINDIIEDWEVRSLCPATGKLCVRIANSALNDSGAIIEMNGFRDLSGRSVDSGGDDICTANLNGKSPESDCGYSIWSGWMGEIATLPNSTEVVMAEEEGKCTKRDEHFPNLAARIASGGEDQIPELLQKCNQSGAVCGLEES